MLTLFFTNQIRMNLICGFSLILLWTTNHTLTIKCLLMFSIFNLNFCHPHFILAAGVGHVALLDADFEKSCKRNRVSEQVSYSLAVEGSVCATWDGHQGAWTRSRCVTQQAGASAAVSCR